MTNSKIERDSAAGITIIGVGGAGANTINRIANDIKDAKFILFDPNNKTRGTSRVGKALKVEGIDDIAETLKNTDLVFIIAGMGGETGTGASPVIADIARKAGISTVAIVTKPFAFEGEKRTSHAEEGIKNLVGVADSLIVISNDKLKLATDKKITLNNAFEIADDVILRTMYDISGLRQGTRVVRTEAPASVSKTNTDNPFTEIFEIFNSK
jgi:cell division protein FtsZ